MGLLSFLKRKSGDAAKAPAIPESADSVQQARTRARQRLVGAVVLVAAGVIGFPLLFETQPRPLPVDIPIEIARKDGAAPTVLATRTPAPRTAAPVVPPSVITENPVDGGRDVAAASAPPAASTAAAVEPKPATKPPAEPKPETKPEAKPEPKPPAKPETKPADSARAQALLEGKPAAAEGRFVVQVGAFAEVTAAREARQKVEKLGLKTYTQVVETSGGKRIRVRVGPFGSRGEADKAADKIKSAGLPSAVYTL
ncbi:MAG: SPOR domain-containing protein [Rhizobacter sp.]